MDIAIILIIILFDIISKVCRPFTNFLKKIIDNFMIKYRKGWEEYWR